MFASLLHWNFPRFPEPPLRSSVMMLERNESAGLMGFSVKMKRLPHWQQRNGEDRKGIQWAELKQLRRMEKQKVDKKENTPVRCCCCWNEAWMQFGCHAGCLAMHKLHACSPHARRHITYVVILHSFFIRLPRVKGTPWGQQEGGHEAEGTRGSACSCLSVCPYGNCQSPLLSAPQWTKQSLLYPD